MKVIRLLSKLILCSTIAVFVPWAELIFGRIYDYIGFNAIGEKLFRRLVIARLAFPLSKLKTIDYLFGYDIFEGNISEGHTLIPFFEEMSRKFNLDKPIVVADSGLLSKENIKALEANGYEYILGARVKNESEKIKGKIPAMEFIDGMVSKVI